MCARYFALFVVSSLLSAGCSGGVDDDTGSFDIPVGMLDEFSLPMYTVALTRFDRAVVEVAPGKKVSFEVGSTRYCRFVD